MKILKKTIALESSSYIYSSNQTSVTLEKNQANLKMLDSSTVQDAAVGVEGSAPEEVLLPQKLFVFGQICGC